MPKRQYKQLWIAVKRIILEHHEQILKMSIRGVRGFRGIRGSYYMVGDLLEPLIGSDITMDDYYWFLTDQGYATYRDDVWPELEQKHGLARPEAALVGVVYDQGVEHPISHLERVWDQARGFIFVEKADEAKAIQELSDYGWTIAAGRGYPTRLIRGLLKGDTRPVIALHDWDPDGEGIYRALGFETRRTKHLDIALRDRVIDLGLNEHQAETLDLHRRPAPRKYKGRPRVELSALNVLSMRMGLDNPVLAYVASAMIARGLTLSPTELSKREMLERHLRWWLSDGIRAIVNEVAEDVAEFWADDGSAVKGYVEGQIVITEAEDLKGALKNTAEDLAYKVRWKSESDYHREAVETLADEALVGILRGGNSYGNQD